MHFKIIVENGHFQLEYKCTTAYEALGCIEALSTGLLSSIPIDMNDVMESLVEMKNGKLLSTQNHGYTICRVEGEV